MRQITIHRPVSELVCAVRDSARRLPVIPTDVEVAMHDVWIPYLSLTRSGADRLEKDDEVVVHVDTGLVLPLHKLRASKLDRISGLAQDEFLHALNTSREDPIRINGYLFLDGTTVYELVDGHHRMHAAITEYSLNEVPAILRIIFPTLSAVTYAISSPERIAREAGCTTSGDGLMRKFHPLSEAVWQLNGSHATYRGGLTPNIEKELLVELLLARGASTVLI